MDDSTRERPVVIDRDGKRDLRGRFCQTHRIAEAGVPLFDMADDGAVRVFAYGRDGRPMLRRSPAMEAMIIAGVEAVLAAPPDQAEGILDMLHWVSQDGAVVPLYVGKAGRHGLSGAAIAANILSIRTNPGKFARWGYNYAYHIGDLSAAVLPGHPVEKVAPKYRRWARRLFVEVPSSAPGLRLEARFWCTPWGPASPSIWPQFGVCPLAFEEYLLIGVAGLLFPDDLLNDEGVNRVATVVTD